MTGARPCDSPKWALALMAPRFSPSLRQDVLQARAQNPHPISRAFGRSAYAHQHPTLTGPALRPRCAFRSGLTLRNLTLATSWRETFPTARLPPQSRKNSSQNNAPWAAQRRPEGDTPMPNRAMAIDDPKPARSPCVRASPLIDFQALGQRDRPASCPIGTAVPSSRAAARRSTRLASTAREVMCGGADAARAPSAWALPAGAPCDRDPAGRDGRLVRGPML